MKQQDIVTIQQVEADIAIAENISGKQEKYEGVSKKIEGIARKLSAEYKPVTEAELGELLTDLGDLPGYDAILAEGKVLYCHEIKNAVTITCWYNNVKILSRDASLALEQLIQELGLKVYFRRDQLKANPNNSKGETIYNLIIENCSKEELKQKIRQLNTELQHASIVKNCVAKLMINNAIADDQMRSLAAAIDELFDDKNMSSLVMRSIDCHLKVFNLFNKDEFNNLKKFLEILLPETKLEITLTPNDYASDVTIKNCSKSELIRKIREKNEAVRGGDSFDVQTTGATGALTEQSAVQILTEKASQAKAALGEVITSTQAAVTASMQPAIGFLNTQTSALLQAGSTLSEELTTRSTAALECASRLTQPARDFIAAKTPDLSRAQIAAIGAVMFAVTLIVLHILDELPEADDSQVISDGKEASATSLPMQFTAQAPISKPDIALIKFCH